MDSCDSEVVEPIGHRLRREGKAPERPLPLPGKPGGPSLRKGMGKAEQASGRGDAFAFRG